jgi:hypothetical protein
MHLFTATICVFLFMGLQQPNKKGQEFQQAPQTDQRGTEQSPLMVKVLVSPKTQTEADQDAEDRKEKSANDRHIVELTGALAVIAFLQFLVYAYQAKKLRETVKSAGEQSEAMERHIGEAARSATAMETIANKIEDGNRMIMRAYVTTLIGGAVYQERRVGQGDLKFEAKVTVLNTGNTPARKVRIRKKAEILPVPIPQDFAYPLPDFEVNSTYATIGAHQNYVIAAIVPDFVADGEVATIKEGSGKALCVWGEIIYEDIFGSPHATKFAHQLTWLLDGKVYGFYIPGRNEAD